MLSSLTSSVYCNVCMYTVTLSKLFMSCGCVKHCTGFLTGVLLNVWTTSAITNVQFNPRFSHWSLEGLMLM